MSHPVKKTKTRSCLHPQKQAPSSDCDYQKYIIIDSQNQQEVINKRFYDSISNEEPAIQADDRGTVIVKSKGSTATNFLSHQREDYCMDVEIINAESEVSELKRECEMLEKLIGEMIEEQAVLKVAMRKKERRLSMQQQDEKNQVRYCHFNYQTQAETLQGYESTSILKEISNNTTQQDPTYTTTPMLSKAIQQKLHKKSLQIIKTVQIKNHNRPSQPKKLKQKSSSKPKQPQQKILKPHQRRTKAY